MCAGGWVGGWVGSACTSSACQKIRRQMSRRCHTSKPVAVLRDQTSVDAVEMFDRASLRECESNEDMLRLVPDIKGGWAAGRAPGAWCFPACSGEVPKGGSGVRVQVQ